MVVVVVAVVVAATMAATATCATRVGGGVAPSVLFGQSVLLPFTEVKMVVACTGGEAGKLGAEERGLKRGCCRYSVVKAVLNNVAAIGSLVTDGRHKLR